MGLAILNPTLGATPGDAVPLSADAGLVATSIVIQAYGGDRDGLGKNQGKLLIGPSTVNGSDPKSGIQIAVPIDGATPPSCKFNSGDNLNLFPLNQIYVAGFYAGDSAVVLYHTVS